MTTQTKPDIASISGVIGNIHELLSLVKHNLDCYKQTPDEIHEIESSRTYIHQLDSLFQILEMNSITVVTEKIEQLITKLIDNKTDNIPLSINAIKHAIDTLISYLNKLVDGAPENPMQLFPAYRDLMHCIGYHQVSEFDLFYPTLATEPSLKPILYEHNILQAKTLAKRARAEYQSGLVLLLKNTSDTNHLNKMHHALDQVEQLPGNFEQRIFWWIATGFLESLLSQESSIELSDCKLCGKIEQALRSFIERSRKKTDQLARELLYRIATRHQTSSPTQRIEDIQTTYALAFLTKTKANELTDLASQQSCLEKMQQTLRQTNENWQALCTNDSDLNTFLGSMAQLREQSVDLQCQPIQQLIESINLAAQSMQTQDLQSATVNEHMEIATALLHLNNILENFNTQSDNISEHIQPVVARLTNEVQSNNTLPRQLVTPTPNDIQSPSLTKQSQKLSIQEVLTNLRQIEKNLEQFFETSEDRTPLSALTNLFNQIGGVLEILELSRANHLLALCHDLEKKFSDPDHHLNLNEQNLLVDGLSSLSFYLEAYKNDQTANQRVLESAIAIFENSASQKASTENNISAHELDPEDSSAPEIEINANIDTQPVNQIDSGINPELLSIFLEEARDILAEIISCLQNCSPDNSDLKFLTNIRRGFHTLKGSSRMVKLDSFSEAAWIMEKTLNYWLNEKKQITVGLIELIQSAHQEFSEWCVSLNTTGKAEIQFDRLFDLINSLDSNQTQVASEIKPDSSVGTTESINLPPSNVFIGDISIPTELFGIFSTESKQHYATLEKELKELQNFHPSQITQPFALAAHTLASTARAINLDFLADLSGKLEEWLTQLTEMHAHLTPSHINLIQNCVDQIGELLSKIHQQQLPDDADLKLVQLLIQEIEKQQESAPETISNEVLPLTQPEFTQEKNVDNKIDDVSSNLLQTFFDETNEIIPQFSSRLRAWRILPQDEDVRINLLRLLHTLKGSAHMIGAQQLGELIHATEEEIEQAFNNPVVSIYSIENVEYQFDQICEAIEQLQHPPSPSPVEKQETKEVETHDFSKTAPDTSQSATTPILSVTGDPIPSATKLEDAHQPINVLRIHAELIDRLVNKAGEAGIIRNKIETLLNQFKHSFRDLNESIDRLHEQIREVEIQAEMQISTQIAQLTPHENFTDPLELDRFSRLHELTRLMSESIDDVITVQRQLNSMHSATTDAVERQATINHELQQELIQIRTIPFGNISERYYRVVRKTANELGKKVELKIHGEDIEIDRSVLEKLSTSLEHILRNAVVHGIEKPDHRIQIGKPEIGKITVDLRLKDNEITIIISDDGTGLDLENIRKEAVKRHLIKESDVLDDELIAAQIFAPGLTTQHHATDTAGRGMGMDIVQNDISGLGGHITVSSESNKSTVFNIQLPLMLAVTNAVFVSSSDQIVTLPAAIVEHIQELNPEALQAAYQKQRINYNGRIYPFTYLPYYLGNFEPRPEIKNRNQVLLLNSDDSLLAIHIDKLLGNHEVIVKKIGPQIMHAPGVEGITVTNDGKPALILNLLKLMQREDVQHILNTPVSEIIRQSSQSKKYTATVLVVDDSLTVRKVIGRLLERKNYNVATAKHGMEAIEMIAAVKPDIILTDLEMPKMNGFELIKAIRNTPKISHTPIIVITSRTAEKHRKMALQLGADEFMGKPYEEDNLLGTLLQFTPRES